jgi:hypothetical protein
MSEEAKREGEELEEQEGELLPDREVMSVARIEPEPPLLDLEIDPKTYEVSPEDPPAT